MITKEKYLQMFKFCKDVDNSKNIKMSFIEKSRESLNEINENYLDKNLFYNSFINQVIINSSSSSNNEDDKNKKSSLNSFNKKSSEEENEKNSELKNSNITKVDVKLKKEGKNLRSSVMFFDE